MIVFCPKKLGDFYFVLRGWVIFFCPETLVDLFCPERLGDYILSREVG